MSMLKKTFAKLLRNNGARRRPPARPRHRFERLESRIVFSGGFGFDDAPAIPDDDGYSLPEVDDEVIAVSNLAGDAEGLSQSADGVIAAFPDVCFTPPDPPAASGVNTNLVGRIGTNVNQSTNLVAEPTHEQAVVVIHHADGTIEWIYDLPSVKACGAEPIDVGFLPDTGVPVLEGLFSSPLGFSIASCAENGRVADLRAASFVIACARPRSGDCPAAGPHCRATGASCSPI